MEHNYDSYLNNDEMKVIEELLKMNFNIPEEYYCEHTFDNVTYLGYAYVKKINYNNKDYIVRICINDSNIRIINKLTITCGNNIHYVDLAYYPDIIGKILDILPDNIDSCELDDYSISYILKSKRFSELEDFDDHLYFVDDYYHHDWFYHSEYKTIKRQLREYLDKNKNKLTKEEIDIINKYISKFNSDNKVVYERQFNYYYNEKDYGTLEKVFVKE